jgi:GlpG protein
MPDDFDYSLPRKARLRTSTEQPIMTMLLIALSVAFTAAYWYSNYDKTSPFRGIANIGVVSAADIWDGKYWALITSMFPHANLMHIAFNMMWTWRLGAAIEKEVHPVAYLFFILGAAILGSGVQLCIAGQTGIGMSGVVYAMFGLMWAGRGSFVTWRGMATRDNLNLFIGWGVLCIVTTYFNIMPVANGAHFGGLLFGLCVGFIWYAPRRRPVFAAPLAALCVITVMSLMWAPWSESWQWWRGNRYAKNGHPLAAIDHYRLSIRLGGAEEPLLENIVISWTDEMNTAITKRDDAGIQRAAAELKRANDALSNYKSLHPGTPAAEPPTADSSDGK